MKRKRRAWVVAALVCLLIPVACGRPQPTGDDVPRMTVQVLGTRPHDPQAFTQGLEIHGDVLYESTGKNGESGVRAYDLTTGTELAGARLPQRYFGEGITRTGDTLWQLTWTDGVAFARDPDTLAERSQVNYPGEGWGLCTRGDSLVMSDGSATLAFRDPSSFAHTRSVPLTSHTWARLNELDCADDGTVYANTWPTDDILRIDPDTGEVLAVIDASGLLPPADRSHTDVLNGIAQIPGTDRFLITGKYWPTTFEVRFVPA